jgi:hypothetical protein
MVQTIKKKTIKAPVLDYKTDSVKIISNGRTFGTAIYVNGVKQDNVTKFEISADIDKPFIKITIWSYDFGPSNPNNTVLQS